MKKLTRKKGKEDAELGDKKGWRKCSIFKNGIEASRCF